jgi:hypothetical protein
MSAPPATCAKVRTPLGDLFNAGELRPCPGRAVGAAAETILTAVAAVLFRPRGQAAGESVPPSVETVNLNPAVEF